MSRLWSIAVLLLVFLPATGMGVRQRLPNGFRDLTDKFWASPWVFDTRGVALRRLHNSMGQIRNGPMPIRLDDGSDGALRVQAKECEPGEDCEPFDCGCTGRNESFWIEVVDREDNVVARMHLWAAYGEFDIVPVDLIEGPGDELMITRIPAHSAPPYGFDLKIWKIGRTKPVALIEDHQVAGVFATDSIGCARWRTNLFVNENAPKPRAVALRGEFAADLTEPGTCWLDKRETTRHAALEQGHTLRFENGQYRRIE